MVTLYHELNPSELSLLFKSFFHLLGSPFYFSFLWDLYGLAERQGVEALPQSKFPTWNQSFQLYKLQTATKRELSNSANF